MTTMNWLRNLPSMLILLGIMLGIITIQMIQRLIALIRRLFSTITNSLWRIWRGARYFKDRRLNVFATTDIAGIW